MAKNRENYKQEVQTRQFLTTEVRFIISIAVFVFGIASPYFGIKQDIALIRSDISNINANHEVHIQDLTQNIKDLNDKEVSQEAQIIELQKQIVTVLSKLSK